MCETTGFIRNWRMQLWRLKKALMALPVLYLSTWQHINNFNGESRPQKCKHCDRIFRNNYSFQRDLRTLYEEKKCDNISEAPQEVSDPIYS